MSTSLLLLFQRCRCQHLARVRRLSDPLAISAGKWSGTDRKSLPPFLGEQGDSSSVLELDCFTCGGVWWSSIIVLMRLERSAWRLTHGLHRLVLGSNVCLILIQNIQNVAVNVAEPSLCYLTSDLQRFIDLWLFSPVYCTKNTCCLGALEPLCNLVVRRHI